MRAPGSRAASFRSRRCRRLLLVSQELMRTRFGVSLVVGLLLVGSAAFGQTAAADAAAANLTFDVASVRPSAPLDMAKLQADMQAGKMPNFGMHLDGLRAEYNYMSLKELVVAAYKVKPYQVICPDWMGTQRYDIVARMPEGAKKDDAPAMLKALLEDRFKLQA